MEQLNKLVIVFICFMLFYKTNAQEGKNFYLTRDTIVVDEPVVLSLKKYDGMFLVSNNDIKQEINIEKLILENKIYIFNTDLYRFFEKKDFEKLIKYKECFFEEISELNKEITIRKLGSKTTKFVLGFVNVDYYNQRVTTVDKGKTYFKNKKKTYFYPIVFPICE